VVAVVEDYCASGAYLVACAADTLLVDPTSIVGSIGVVKQGFGFSKAMQRWAMSVCPTLSELDHF